MNTKLLKKKKKWIQKLNPKKPQKNWKKITLFYIKAIVQFYYSN